MSKNPRLPSTADLVRTTLRFLEQHRDKIGAGWWTEHLAKALFRMFPKSRVGNRTLHARRVPAAGCASEYLLDLTISADTTAAKHAGPFEYRGLLLAAEVEWSPHAYLREYDFCKVLDIRAHRKLFVGALTGSREQTASSVLTKMRKFIDRHDFVSKDEEFGIAFTSYGQHEPESGWIVRKNQAATPVELARTISTPIPSVSDHLQAELRRRRIACVDAVTAAAWLSASGVLRDSKHRRGRPLRNLLRAGAIAGQRQEPNGRWFIDALGEPGKG